VHVRIDAEHHLSGIGLLRLFADLLACLDVIIDRLVKGLAQGFDRVGMKADSISNARNTPGEDAVLVVVVDAGGIALVGHGAGHGVTPEPAVMPI
jgi:hypothetical protein